MYVCVCIANTWIRLTAKGQRKMQQDLLVPQLRIFNVSFKWTISSDFLFFFFSSVSLNGQRRPSGNVVQLQ